MRVFSGLNLVSASLLLAWLALATPRSLPASDDNKTADGSTTTAHKPDAPPPKTSSGLTEREQWLLERVEQLEQRVAELEAKQKQSTVATESVTVAPTSVSHNASYSVTAATQIISASSSSLSPSVPVGPPPSQASEQGKPGAAAAAEKPQPFSFADFTWMNGNARTKEVPWDTKFFTPEIRFDTVYIYDFNHPKDDTIGGSAEVFRAQEFQVTQIGVGGDFHYDNVRGRLMTQLGMYSETQPRNDASPARGQWNLADAYRYVSEAYGGYHFNVNYGLNVDAGIFMSYIGLFSWYNFDNWAYQPSYVSSNTPFFFNGLRVQWFPTEKLKIEPWLINGWQSYGRFNNRPGLGFQVLYRPNGNVSIVSNGYAIGADTLNNPGRIRYHSDNSLEVKYYDNPENFLDKMAFSLTGDIGCEHGGGVSCAGGSSKGPKQSFLGFMIYDRLWFDRDLFAVTLGGGKINNPGRYLVLLPPINGATAITGSPYFTQNPGDPFKAWDASLTFDYMPSQYITFRWEYDHRAANVPYFSGAGGITPPGGNNGNPASLVCSDGSVAPSSGCGSLGLWQPDLRKVENRLNMAILVKF